MQIISTTSFWTRLRWFLFGYPIPSKLAIQERLPKYIALTVFSSDALSSVAYATEEIRLMFLRAYNFGREGYAMLWLTSPISFAICFLIFAVSASYYQTVHAYPGGGGSYIVAKANLGEWAGCIAGASLLIDYILTVAVSVTAGVLAIVSMAPITQPYIVEMGVGAVLLIMGTNLRGMRDSGAVFALPVYAFIFLVLMIVAVGFFKQVPPSQKLVEIAQNNFNIISIFVILRAFSSGCTAMTGIEAISNGVQAFREPVSRNASITLVWMSSLLGIMFLGISILSSKFHIIPMTLEGKDYKTVLAQLCGHIMGEGWVFYALQIMTAGILILAANTSFADFPRLSSIISRDGYLPRALGNLGDRLVYQNGIITLALFSIVLILGFRGDTSKLIPLYAIGVFLSFTLSQFGMVVHSLRENKKKISALISLIGGITTGVVTIIVFTTKFTEGAWIVMITLGILLLSFWGIKRHYNYISKQLCLSEADGLKKISNIVLILVPRLNRGVLEAVAYAKSVAKDSRGVHVMLDIESTERMKEEWSKYCPDIPLILLDSPYRSLIDPIIEYIDQVLAENPDHLVTVIVPQAVLKHWWQNLLHNNIAMRLKFDLSGHKNVVITNVQYFVN